MDIGVTVRIGPYEITPHDVPDDIPGPADKVWIEILRVDTFDEHDHPRGPERTVRLEDLFKDEPKWS